ncbi:MAG: hypothetical protein SPL30_10490 [Succinivibrio sp.]|nr:hypothetical protein [Succinivibrio sp.]
MTMLQNSFSKDCLALFYKFFGKQIKNADKPERADLAANRPDPAAQARRKMQT